MSVSQHPHTHIYIYICIYIYTYIQYTHTRKSVYLYACCHWNTHTHTDLLYVPTHGAHISRTKRTGSLKHNILYVHIYICSVTGKHTPCTYIRITTCHSANMHAKHARLCSMHAHAHFSILVKCLFMVYSHVCSHTFVSTKAMSFLSHTFFEPYLGWTNSCITLKSYLYSLLKFTLGNPIISRFLTGANSGFSNYPHGTNISLQRP